MRELAERFPALKDTNVAEGRAQRSVARAALKDLVICLRRIDIASAGGRFDEAASEYIEFRKLITTAPVLLQNAEPWSLFDQGIHDAHYSVLRQMYAVPNGSSR